MSDEASTLERRLRAARLVPVVRTGDATSAMRLVERLVEGGLRTLEVTTTIPGWDRLVRRLRDESSELFVGVGTVTSSEQAHAAIEAGAQFCVSPRLVAAPRRALEDAGVPFVEGGLTPTEVLDAGSRGIAKLFPAGVVGVGYLRSLLSVAPDARIMPTGGIPLCDVGAWLAAGAVAVGVGGDLTAPGNIADRVAEALDA